MLQTFIEQLSERFRQTPSSIGGKMDVFFKDVVSQQRDALAKHLLGSGSEALVFKLAHPDATKGTSNEANLVLKVFLERTLQYLDEDVPPTREFTQFVAGELAHEQQLLEAEWDTLINTFGNDVARIRFRIEWVPVLPHDIQLYRPQWAKQSNRLPKELPVLLAVQRRVSAREDRINIAGNIDLVKNYFLQNDPARRQEFGQAYRTIVATDTPHHQQEAVEDIMRVYAEIRGAARMIQQREAAGDHGVQEAFRHALQKLISFVDASRLPLDIAGSSNIILQDKGQGSGWRLKLIDPLPPGHERLDELERMVAQLKRQSHAALSPDQKQRIAYSLNNVLVLNGYAICLGIPERVHVTGLETISSEQWLRTLEIRPRP